MFSAVRLAGRRLHRAARAGERVERAPRTIRIDSLELLAFEPAGSGLAFARLAVRCGKGTYVRTLAFDLGRALGIPAHLAALRRTASGPFVLSQAIPLAEAERLGREDPAALRARLVPAAEALGFMPAVALAPAQALDLCHGRALRLAPPGPGLCRALDAAGRLVAVCTGGDGWLRPVRVLATPAEVSCQITPENH
jgi:tRNA pseudouridine55 synthase